MQSTTEGYAKVNASFGGDWEYPADSSISINDGQWHHIAGVVSENRITLYVDGEKKASKTGGTGLSLGSMCVLTIGIHPTHPTRSDIYFNGSIDEIKIYDTALSAEEIVEYYQSF
jgi:hypothetical protein